MSQTAPASKRHQRIPAEAATDTGNVRSVNEDRYWNAPETFDLISISRKGQLFVVADGMGGYHAGDIAAEIVVKTMGDSYYSDAANAMQDVMGALKYSIAQSPKEGQRRAAQIGRSRPDGQHIGRRRGARGRRCLWPMSATRGATACAMASSSSFQKIIPGWPNKWRPACSNKARSRAIRCAAR